MHLSYRDHSHPDVPQMNEGTFKHQKLNVHASFDDRGFRINPYKCEEDENLTKVLVVGDSNVAALFLEDQNSLGAQLNRDLNKIIECVVVDSFGVSGFGPHLAYKAIKKITEYDTYDIVLFHIFADNDLGDIIRGNDFNDNNLKDNGYCYVENHYLNKFVSVKLIRKAIFELTGKYILWEKAISTKKSFDKCILLPTFNDQNFALSMFKRFELDKLTFLEGNRQIYMSGRYDLEFSCSLDTNLEAYAINALKIINRNMLLLSKKFNFNYYFLIQPSEFDVTNNSIDESLSIKNFCPDEYSPSNLTDIFIKSFDNKHVINLYQSFYQCNKCYFTEAEYIHDNHWSSYGVSVAVQKIINELEEMKLLNYDGL